MYEFLLAEKHFRSLKKYFDFLRALPAVLDKLKIYSDGLQRKGHVLIEPPDAERLKFMASMSSGYLARLEADIAMLGQACHLNISYIETFSDECRKIAAQSAKQGKNLSIGTIDFKLLSLSRSPWWIWFPPRDVKGLTHELYFRLGRTTSALLEFKAIPKELHLDIHNVFEGFLRALSFPPCQCHLRYSRIEGWYVEAGGNLPGMNNPLSPGSSGPVRLARSNEHLRELRVLKREACSAIINLNDFVFVMCRFVAVAEKDLLAVKPTMKLAQLVSSLAHTENVLKEVKSMADTMQRWSLP